MVTKQKTTKTTHVFVKCYYDSKLHWYEGTRLFEIQEWEKYKQKWDEVFGKDGKCYFYDDNETEHELTFDELYTVCGFLSTKEVETLTVLGLNETVGKFQFFNERSFENIINNRQLDIEHDKILEEFLTHTGIVEDDTNVNSCTHAYHVVVEENFYTRNSNIINENIDKDDYIKAIVCYVYYFQTGKDMLTLLKNKIGDHLSYQGYKVIVARI